MGIETNKQVNAINNSRYAQLLSVMENILGERVPQRNRKPKYVWARAMIAYKMYEQEQYRNMDIARQMGLNHASVINLRDKMNFAVAHPFAFKDIIKLWKQFNVESDEIDRRTIQESLKI